MYVSRVRLLRFRGFTEQEILPRRHAVVVGEPRAGCTDLITALRRVLDPGSVRNPDLSDVHRPLPDDAEDGEPAVTEVEVTLLGLGERLEQYLHDRLELVDPQTGLPAGSDRSHEAVLGVRLLYRLTFDEQVGEPEHLWMYPKSGDRAPRVERLALAAVVIGPGAPLQLRTGALFRRLIAELDEGTIKTALETLADDVATATGKLADLKTVRQALVRVLDDGVGGLLGLPSDLDDDVPDQVIGFGAGDGSVEALLRRLQATLALDDAGTLPVAGHGTTATTVLAVAEAMAAADLPGAVVLADDFGDGLDAGAAEYLAALLRRKSGQVWLATRRPEVVRAFEVTEVLRLTRSHGQRRHHQLPPAIDRKERLARRPLHALLMPAMTNVTVGLLEGPHDLEALTAGAARRLRQAGIAPPAAYRVHLAANLLEGGKDQLPKLARLARQLGFHVRVVLDNDKPGTDSDLRAELAGLAEQVIVLPMRTAIERALVAGVPASALRQAAQALRDVYGLKIDIDGLADDELGKAIAKEIKKPNLHQQFLEALPEGVTPPLVEQILDTLSAPPLSNVLVELPAPQAPTPEEQP
jgi:putative ATP-dependent endonuclease of OLD family